MKAKALTTLNKVLLAVLCAIFALSAGIILAISLNADGDNVELKDQYVVGDVLFFPKNEFEVEGKKYTYETFVVKPDGSTVKGERVAFADAGVYTLMYVKEVDGKVYSEEYEIKVVAPIYDVTSNRSSATYYDNYVYKAYDKSRDINVERDTGHSGIHVSLAQGTSFKYNKIIDLREFGPKEEIIQFYVTPSEIPLRDMTDIIVKLTDAYNDTNTVYFNYSALTHRYGASVWNTTESELFVGTSMSELRAIRTNAIEKGDTWYRYGYGSNHSWSGRQFLQKHVEDSVYTVDMWKPELVTWGDDIIVGTQFLSAAIDETNGHIYGYSNINTGTTEAWDTSLSEGGSGDQLVANLKDGTVFSSIWGGFTTGEVYLEIYATNYEKDYANFFINKLAHEDFSEMYFEGGSMPGVIVESGEYGDNAPDALVGKAYPLFDANGRTIQGEVPASIDVYYNYDSSSAISVNVVDNAFTPDRAGDYTILYTVKDSYGHVNTKRYDVVAHDNVGAFTATTATTLSTALMGEEIKLPAVNVENAFGNITNKITITKPNGDVVEVDGDTYIFDASGNHTVKYVVSDYVGQTTEVTYTVNATTNATPVARDELYLPNYLAKGFTAKFPEYTFYDYSGDTVKAIPATITVKDGSGNHVLPGNTYQIKELGDIEVIYSATVGGVTKSLPAKTIKVIDPMREGSTTKIDSSKFIIPYGDAEVTSVSGGANVYCDDADGGFTTYQPIIANGAQVKVQIDKVQNNFNKLTITFTDAYNPNQQLQVAFAKVGITDGKIAFYYNGDRTYASIAPTFLNGGVLTAKFQGGIMKINVSEVSILVDKYLNGEPFEGFTSGLVNVDVKLEDVKAESSVIVNQIGSQSLRSSVQFDNGKPDIAVNGLYNVSAKPGDKIKIFSAQAADVIDYNIVGHVSVQDPDKNYVVATDGTELREVDFSKEYEVELSIFGTYSIVYTAKDTRGNEQRYTVAIGVYDFEKPTITIDGKIKDTAKLGDDIDLPEASVVDNVDVDLVYYVYIRRPDQVYLPASKVTTYDQEGTYNITYMAIDSAGNANIIIYKVQVSK